MQNQIALSLLSTPTLGDNMKQAENDYSPLNFSCNADTVTTTNYDTGIGFLRLPNFLYSTCHSQTIL